MTELPTWLIVALAVAGPAIAVIGALGSQALSNRGEAIRVRSEAHLTGRAPAYLELAEFAVRLRAMAAGAAPGRAKEVGAFAEQLGTEKWWSVQARVSAYGSESVRQAFNDLLGLRIDLTTNLAVWEEILQFAPPLQPEEMEVLEQFQTARDATVKRCEELLYALNQELSPDIP